MAYLGFETDVIYRGPRILSADGEDSQHSATGADEIGEGGGSR